MKDEIDLTNIRTDCRFYNEFANRCKAVGEKTYRDHTRGDFYHADDRRCIGCSFFKPKETDKTKGE